jgi:cell division protein FtsW
MIRRTDRGPLAEWWWTVDRVSFFLILALIVIGLMLAVAASPTVFGGAASEGDFQFAAKQIAFALMALGILIATSLMTPTQACRFAFCVFVLALLGLLAVQEFGVEINKSKRWLAFGWMTLQPSEFLKPGFAVLAAAVLSANVPGRIPKPVLTLAMIAPAVYLLVKQPDVGQTFLLLALWGTLLFFSGASFKWIATAAAMASALVVIAYNRLDYVQHRIDQFLDPSATAHQTTLSLKAFAHGGLLGAGPGAGTVKYQLPEAHSDYIFAVAGEEFGFVLCFAIAVLFCVLAVRLMLRSARTRDPFAQLAGAGLAVAVALQAFINMGVAIRLLPAKGMTLPFISYGGSSLFAVAMTMGLALALTRERGQIGVRQASFDLFAWGGT